MASETVVAPLPPAPVPAPDAWPGASKDKISRKILAINTWRAEVASHEDGITCACSNGFSPVDGAPTTDGSDNARSRPLSCEVCQRPSSSAADDSSNTNGNGNAKSRGSSSRPGSGGLGSVRRVLRRLGTGHRSNKTSTPPTTAVESQMSTAGTRMYTAQQEIANTAGEDSDDEGSSEDGGLKSKEARLRRAQKLLAKHNHHHRGLSGGARGGVDQNGQEPVR